MSPSAAVCHDVEVTDRLSPSDAAFLYDEHPAAPLHVGGVVIIEPGGDFDFAAIARVVEERLDVLPRLRQVVREVPGKLARPVWVDDPAFDLDYHVRRSALPSPGSEAQLAELVGRLISRPLDRRRPLWELYIVEGLEGGRVALVNKTHEALLGALGVVDIASAVLDERPKPVAAKVEPWIPAPAPGTIDLMVDAIEELVARPGAVIDTARRWSADVTQVTDAVLGTARAMIDVARRSFRPARDFPLRSSSAGPRYFATADLDLAQIKRIRRAHGGTVNDVILTVVAGAARAWMLSRGEPVTSGSSLTALAPTTVWDDETDGDARPAAQVTSTLVDLPIAEPNAVMRLHQVSFQMAAQAESHRLVGADALLQLGRFAPAALHGMGARVAGQLSRRSYDILVTNVPGPQRRLYAAGNPVAALYPVVPLVKDHVLAIGCTSYRGTVHVGLTAASDVMPEVAEVAQLIVDSAAELAATSPVRSRSRRPAGREER